LIDERQLPFRELVLQVSLLNCLLASPAYLLPGLGSQL
jgi:hypothetical protein